MYMRKIVPAIDFLGFNRFLGETSYQELTPDEVK